MLIKLAPSILSADFSNLGKALSAITEGGGHYVHIDVMDGHFVPNITIGPLVAASLRKTSRLVFDVHLMISEPERFIAPFAKAGADIICFHMEAAKEPEALIKQIKSLGKIPAAAIKPATSPDVLLPYLPELGMVLVMSVEPGFGGQTLIPEALDKARMLRRYIDRVGLACDIEMDGGIKLDNAGEVINAGVNVLVAGSDIFHADNPINRIKDYITLINKLSS